METQREDGKVAIYSAEKRFVCSYMHHSCDTKISIEYKWRWSYEAFPQLQIKEITRGIQYIFWLWSGYKQYIHTNFL